MYTINKTVDEFKQCLGFLTFKCFLGYIWFQNKTRTEYSSGNRMRGVLVPLAGGQYAV